MVLRVLYASSPVWAGLGERLDKLLGGPEFRVLKKTPHTLAGIGRLDGAEVFVKRVESRAWSRGVVARLRGSRAKMALRGADILQRAGFAHPRPLAAYDKLRLGGIQASYIVLEMLRRPRILSRFALADGRDFHWRQRLSDQLADAIRRLHNAGCYTRDLQDTNLMVEPLQSGELTVYFIDLEDFRRRRTVPSSLRMLNLIHLDRSIGRFLSRSQRLRFLYSYIGGRPGRAQARDLVMRLHRMSRRIERRKRRERGSRTIVTPIANTSEDSG